MLSFFKKDDNTISVSRCYLNHLKSYISIVNWIAESEEIRQVSTEILLNTVTIREVNSTEIDTIFT